MINDASTGFDAIQPSVSALVVLVLLRYIAADVTIQDKKFKTT
jgi:hypothetical protein